MSVSPLKLIAALALTVPLSAATCPNPPSPNLAVARIPEDVCIPTGFTDLTIGFFDDYSWRAFLALVSPATETGPRIFETFHPRREIFHEDGSPPGTAARDNACLADTKSGDMVLGSLSAIEDVGQTADGALVGPLVAQNGHYVRYLTAYNGIAYNHIVSNKWYLRSHLPEVPVPRPPVPPVQFPVGSIVVKSAWIEMDGFSPEQRRRYYTRVAMVKNPDTGKCASALVGSRAAADL